MTPVPQRNIDTFGGGSIPKNPDPVAAFKERLKEKVNKAKEVGDGMPKTGFWVGYNDAVEMLLDLINETK